MDSEATRIIRMAARQLGARGHDPLALAAALTRLQRAAYAEADRQARTARERGATLDAVAEALKIARQGAAKRLAAPPVAERGKGDAHA